MFPGMSRVTKLRRHTHASVVVTIQRAENKQVPDVQGALNRIFHVCRLLSFCAAALVPVIRLMASTLGVKQIKQI